MDACEYRMTILGQDGMDNAAVIADAVQQGLTIPEYLQEASMQARRQYSGGEQLEAFELAAERWHHKLEQELLVADGAC